MQTKSNKERSARACHRLGIIIAAVALLFWALAIWAVPAWAEDGPPARSQARIVTEGGPDWLDQWWVEPDLEWDNDDGVDWSIDAEIGHMVTDRLGFWGRPAYRADHGEQTEDWDLRFGLRYRLN